MTANPAVMLAWFRARQGRVTYNMNSRLGPYSYDCSSAVYFAGVEGGMSTLSWPCSTETEHDWLIANGWTLLAENQEFDIQEGDVFIWGKKGFSLGAFGHTGMFLDSNGTIIHCNYGNNGISIDDHDTIWSYNGQPYFYFYRYTGATTHPNPAQITTAQSSFEKELDAGTHLPSSEQPYYEATVSEDYWVEAQPFAGAEEKELFKAGSRVRVYEKVDGYSRIGSPQSAQWIDDNYLIDANDMDGKL